MEQKQERRDQKFRDPSESPGPAKETAGEAEVEVRKIVYGSEDYAQSLKLRDRVLRRPLGRSIAGEDLSGDAQAKHIGAFLGKELVGILLLRPYRERILQMKQVAVEESLRGLNIGRKLVGYAEEIAAEEGVAEIMLHARETAVPFYEKLGYVREGERFEEIGIPHYVMRKPLAYRVD